MPSTTRNAFFRNADKTQNIGPTPTPPPVPVTEKVEEVKEVTISKAEYDRLVEAEKQLQELKAVLNK